MAEKKLLLVGQTLNYEGLFDLKKLFLEIDQWISERGYNRHEFTNTEQVTEKGKQIHIVMKPWKQLSDYANSEIELEMTFKDIVDVEIDHDGIKEKLQKGKVTIEFHSRLITDVENKWEGSAMFQFLRTFTDKFVHKSRGSDFEKECRADCTQLQEEIKAFLNLFRYKS